MFAREQKAQLIKHGKRLNPDRKPVKGNNRRIVALLPDRKFAQADLLVNGKSSIYQQLLSIEANNLSCCVKITSPRLKSRSSLLIYKGQIIGCVYGSKRIANQLFGQEAYEKVMSDITRFDNFIDGYILPPQMALAAGSMFHEDLIVAENDEPPVSVARRALARFEATDSGGCIVVTTANNVPVSVMYFAQQTLLGSQVLSQEKAPQDRAPQDLNKLWQYLELHPEAKVFASMLSDQLATDLTVRFSRFHQEASSCSSGKPDVDSPFGGVKITLMRAMRTQKMPEPVVLNRFVNINKSATRPGLQGKLSHRFRGVGFYDVDPR